MNKENLTWNEWLHFIYSSSPEAKEKNFMEWLNTAVITPAQLYSLNIIIKGS